MGWLRNIRIRGTELVCAAHNDNQTHSLHEFSSTPIHNYANRPWPLSHVDSAMIQFLQNAVCWYDQLHANNGAQSFHVKKGMQFKANTVQN